ncbi:MAG: DUF4382 domain-containing protein [Robiginitalea sp.]|nr:DUF4382 domain-containing protein [Robiginitalea sp.]
MNTRIFMGLLIALNLFLSGCAEDADDRNPDGMGRLTVRLTDAPFPYDEVAEANVTIFKVELRRASDDDYEGEEGESMEDDGGSPFITLMEEDIAVNLLTLVNGVTEEIADLEIPAGTYDLVRVYVEDASVVLKDGETYDLKVPSGAQTGIKVFIKPGVTVSGGLSSDLLLDFDVSKSFVARGNINRPNFNGFIFKPVIMASNTSTSGSLTGSVTELMEEMEVGLEGALVSVIAADTVYKSVASGPDGNYLIDGILAGSYRAVAEKDTYISSDTVDIEIAVANRTLQNFLLQKEESTEENTDGN